MLRKALSTSDTENWLELLPIITKAHNTTKLSKLNLVVEALRDSKQLEGKMNGASANLWRGLMEESGGDGNRHSFQWLQKLSTGTGDKSSNQSGKGTNTNSISTETTKSQ